MSYLIASFFMSMSLHGWLVFRHWNDNPASISYHAVQGRLEFRVYMAGHVVNGLLVGGFVYDLFYGRPNFGIVAAIAVVAILAEWLQAFIPAKDKTDKTHTFFASVMAASMALFALACTLLYAPNSTVRLINFSLSIILFSFLAFISYPPKQGFWKLQLAGQLLVYVQVFLLVQGQ